MSTSAGPDALPATPAPGALADFARVLAERWPSGAVAAVTVRAPVAPLDALWAWRPASPGVLWDPPAGVGFVGSGVAAAIEVTGEGRMHELADRGAQLLARVCERRIAGVVAPSVLNAIAAATGKPVRSLPLKRVKLV